MSCVWESSVNLTAMKKIECCLRSPFSKWCYFIHLTLKVHFKKKFFHFSWKCKQMAVTLHGGQQSNNILLYHCFLTFFNFRERWHQTLWNTGLEHQCKKLNHFQWTVLSSNPGKEWPTKHCLCMLMAENNEPNVL